MKEWALWGIRNLSADRAVQAKIQDLQVRWAPYRNFCTQNSRLMSHAHLHNEHQLVRLAAEGSVQLFQYDCMQPPFPHLLLRQVQSIAQSDVLEQAGCQLDLNPATKRPRIIQQANLQM